MNYLWNENSLTLSYRTHDEPKYRSIQVVTTGEIEHYDGEGDYDEQPSPSEAINELMARMNDVRDSEVRERFYAIYRPVN